MNILLIPMAAPYDGVKHAGGNIANYYLNSYVEQPDMDVTLITWQNHNEISRFYYQKKGIHVFLHASPKINRKLHNKVYQMVDADYASYMFDVPYMKDVERDLKKLKAAGYVPDVILLQWTQIVLLEKEIRKYYPSAKYIAIEEDVSFLGFYRRYLLEKKPLSSFMKRCLYRRLLARELSAVSASTVTIVNNRKDFRLLQRCRIPENQIYQWVPYYHSYEDVDRSGHNQTEIIFFGALQREENYTAVIWFIENVFCKLDSNFVFTVIGNQPHSTLLPYASDRITFTGFVKDIAPYLSRCLCMAAPLQFGAGIKIKVLEGMSAGVPVLTGKVGIEGIGGRDGKTYLHCETRAEYVQAINKLANDREYTCRIAENAREHIARHFDLNQSKKDVLTLIREL